jgi:thioredoxin-related protein
MIMVSSRLVPILTALILSAVVVYAEGVNFITVTSWSEALELSKKANKPIFLDAFTDWCGWCKVMDKETFSDPDVATFMNANFVNVKMEMETGEGIDVAMKYRISSFPTFKVFAVDGTPTYTVMGYQPPKDWLKSLALMTDASKAQRAKGVTATLKLAYPDWHRGAYLKGKSKTIADAKIVQAWFDEQKDRMSEVAWCVINRYQLSEAQQEWVMDHEADYRDLYGDEFDHVIQMRAQSVFGNAVAKKDKSLLEKATDLITRSSPDASESIRDRLQAMYFGRIGEWMELADVIVRMSLATDASADQINEYAWDMYQKCDDKAPLLKAAEAMKRTTAKLESVQWAFVDTYAALLYKTGQYDEAEQQAIRAIEMGATATEDVSSTEELLTKIRAARSTKTDSK